MTDNLLSQFPISPKEPCRALNGEQKACVKYPASAPLARPLAVRTQVLPRKTETSLWRFLPHRYTLPQRPGISQRTLLPHSLFSRFQISFPSATFKKLLFSHFGRHFLEGLRTGVDTVFCTGSDSKYYRLCRKCSLCADYSTALVQNSHRQVGMAVFP